MSRIGKKSLKLGAGTTVSQSGQAVTVKGPKGSIVFDIPASIAVKSEGGVVRVSRSTDTKPDRACHGMVRSILENHIAGVVTPFSRTLDIQGVGYQASKKGNSLVLKVGYSNDIVFDVPKGLVVELPSATRIVVSGVDKQLVGQFSAQVRRTRPPEPYNGKGIRYEGERVERKAGKSFSSAG